MPHDADTEMSSWLDRRVLDRNGDVFGTVVDVYVDAITCEPTWLAISTGMFGTRIAVAPVHGASLLGGDVVVAHSKLTVASAPSAQPRQMLDPSTVLAITHHYALGKLPGDTERNIT